MDTRLAMWVHGVSAYPEHTAGDGGADGPLKQAYNIPWSDVVGLRQGFGALFRGKSGHDNWFHFAIPTPVIVPVFRPNSQRPDLSQRIRLEKVFVMYQNQVGARNGALARITQVDVRDGAGAPYGTRLVAPRPLSDPGGPAPTDETPSDAEPLWPDDYAGQHLQIQNDWNAWLITRDNATITPPVYWGISISVHVHFAVESDILFVSAGADFLLEVP